MAVIRLMNLQLLLPLLTTAAVAAIGWFAAHWFAVSRDRTNKRREMRLTRLMDAYSALERSAHRPFVGALADAVSDAFADIQLLGSPPQVHLAQSLMMELSNNQAVDWQPLLLSIRNEIRKELQSDDLPPILKHLRAGVRDAEDNR
jgi:hypothetical protein